jgi:hypothetical protein
MVTAGTILQIPIILGNERSQGVGQMKENDEGIRFHTWKDLKMPRGGVNRLIWNLKHFEHG